MTCRIDFDIRCPFGNILVQRLLLLSKDLNTNNIYGEPLVLTPLNICDKLHLMVFGDLKDHSRRYMFIHVPVRQNNQTQRNGKLMKRLKHLQVTWRMWTTDSLWPGSPWGNDGEEDCLWSLESSHSVLIARRLRNIMTVSLRTPKLPTFCQRQRSRPNPFLPN